MAELRDIVAYLCDRYPYPNELSNARLTKMIYLADWKSAIEREEQLTNLSWEFSHYGPYVPNVIRLARSEKDFEVKLGETIFVIHSVDDKSFTEFVKLVYSTYPIVTQERYSILDLVNLAKEYKEVAPLLGS
jgi:hypothetical protein